jgi:multidrug efflux pump subunit AcrA (membrane-fusion protein)
MMVRGLAVAAGMGVSVVVLSAAWAQAPSSSARVDISPLELTAPDRYLIPTVLEPVRRVTLVAPADGALVSQKAKIGDEVKEGQEVAQLDRTEAAARLKAAQAEVREQQAALEVEAARGGDDGSASKATRAMLQARVEAAQAWAELAQIVHDRMTLRAPFAGSVLASPVSDGQFISRGTAIAEVADVSSLRALVPAPRTSAAVGENLTIEVEGQSVTARVQALVPLPQALGALHDLATPLVAAWVVLPNPDQAFQPGMRVLSPTLPTAPVAVVAAQAVHEGEAPSGDQAKSKKKGSDEKARKSDGEATVKVLRNEYVTDVKVRVLGRFGPDRVQVSGPFRPNDSLLVSSSVPLTSGTLLRFDPNAAEAKSAEPSPPNEKGSAGSSEAAAPSSSKGAATKSKTDAKKPAETKAAPK